jgi:hypothetical protein
MKELIALALLLLIPFSGAEDNVVMVVDIYPVGPILGTNSNNPTAWMDTFYQVEPIGEPTGYL